MKSFIYRPYNYSRVRKFSSFFLLYIIMEIKNLKIQKRYHTILKAYCKKKGLVMSRFLESLIEKTCKDKKDIYGE